MEKKTKLIIMINGQPIVLEGFGIIHKDGLCDFAVKYFYKGKEKACLYYWDNETSAKTLTEFFKDCRIKNITPYDLVMLVKDEIKRREKDGK